MNQIVARDPALGAGNRRPRGLRAGGDNEFVTREFFTVDHDFLRADELGFAPESGDTQFFEAAFFSLRPARDETILSLDDGCPVKGDMLGPLETQAAGVARLPVELDGAHEHLFGDSTAGEAGAGETLLFDDGDAGAELYGGFRGVRAGGAAADDDQIVIHGYSPALSSVARDVVRHRARLFGAERGFERGIDDRMIGVAHHVHRVFAAPDFFDLVPQHFAQHDDAVVGGGEPLARTVGDRPLR